MENFGSAQARVYAGTLTAALQELSAGPDLTRVKAGGEIGANIRTLHVAHNGRKGRHLIMFRVSTFQQQNVIDVLRLLHDSMDLKRHLPTSDGEK